MITGKSIPGVPTHPPTLHGDHQFPLPSLRDTWGQREQRKLPWQKVCQPEAFMAGPHRDAPHQLRPPFPADSAIGRLRVHRSQSSHACGAPPPVDAPCTARAATRTLPPAHHAHPAQPKAHHSFRKKRRSRMWWSRKQAPQFHLAP